MYSFFLAGNTYYIHIVFLIWWYYYCAVLLCLYVLIIYLYTYSLWIQSPSENGNGTIWNHMEPYWGGDYTPPNHIIWRSVIGPIGIIYIIFITSVQRPKSPPVAFRRIGRTSWLCTKNCWNALKPKACGWFSMENHGWSLYNFPRAWCFFQAHFSATSSTEVPELVVFSNCRNLACRLMLDVDFAIRRFQTWRSFL